MAAFFTISARVLATFRAEPGSGDAPPGTEAPSRLAWIAAAASVAFAGALVLNLFALAATWDPMPFWDHWETVLDYQWTRANGLSWERLVAQHNEHRIVPSRLLAHLDYRLFGGTGLSLQLVSVVGSVGSVLLLLRGVRATARLERAMAALAALAIGTSVAQLGNLGWSFQTAWFVVLALGLLSITAWAGIAGLRAGDRAAWLRACGAWLAAAAATFSNGNGQLVWIVLAIVAAVHRYPKRLQAANIAVAVAVLALHYRGYHAPSNHPPLSASLAHPLVLAEFALRCAANAFARFGRWAQILAGAALMGVVAAEVQGAMLRRNAARRPGAPLLLGALLFLAGSVVATALARAGMEGGASYANEARYATYSVFLVVAAILAVASRLHPARFATRALAASLAVATLLVTWSGFGHPWREALAIRDTKRTVAACAASGHCPAHELQRVYPLDGIAERLAFLQAERLGPFAHTPPFGARPLRAGTIGWKALPGCTGFVDRIAAGRDGIVTVDGWMVWSGTREVPSAVSAVSRDDDVVGGGGVCEPRVDVQRHLRIPLRGRHRLFGFRAWAAAGSTPAAIVGHFGDGERRCALPVHDERAGAR